MVKKPADIGHEVMAEHPATLVAMSAGIRHGLCRVDARWLVTQYDIDAQRCIERTECRTYAIAKALYDRNVSGGVVTVADSASSNNGPAKQ
jgi:hypothetical protein